MDRNSALRKVGLLGRITPENGCTPEEAETARRLRSRLLERHASTDDSFVDSPRVQPESRLSWVYWEHIASAHHATLTRFGTRGSVSLDAGMTTVHINLATGEWHVKRRSPDGYKPVTQGQGIEAFRVFMRGNAPRAYTFTRR